LRISQAAYFFDNPVGMREGEVGRHNKAQHKKKLFWVLLSCIIVLEFWALAQRKNNGSINEEHEIGKENLHFPELSLLKNALILGEGPDGVTVFYEGRTEHYAWKEQEKLTDQDSECCIADIMLSDQAVVQIDRKRDRIHGIVQSWDEDSVEIENYGSLRLQEDFRGYRVYGMPEKWDTSHLKLGYDFADFVIENGEICAILFAREEPMETIRVLLRTDQYEKLFHEKIILCGEQELTLHYSENGRWKDRILHAGEELRVDKDSPLWETEGQRIRIIPDSLTGRIGVVGLKRDTATQWYYGEMEIFKTTEGLALINVLPLEEYLYHVVPSEMPSSYPMEALKAQAICARTYALGRIKQAAFPSLGAHLDDSTMFQVYHNIPAQEATTNAVKSTYGMILATEEGDLAETYYYSTSCGKGTDEAVWGKQDKKLSYLAGKTIGRSEVREWLQNGEMEDKDGEKTAINNEEPLFLLEKSENDYEREEAWYRWNYVVEKIDTESFASRLTKLSREKTEEGAELHTIRKLEVTCRGCGGAAVSLLVETDAGDFHVDGEYGIREVLCDDKSSCRYGNGGESICTKLLPSSFFLIEPRIVKGNVVGYSLIGGGLGHGVGMSQNGARHMAMDGLRAEEILSFFFEGCKIVSAYEVQ